MVYFISSAKEWVVFGGLESEVFRPNFLRNTECLIPVIKSLFFYSDTTRFLVDC